MNKLLIILVFLSACGPPVWPGDPQLHGVYLVVEPGVPAYAVSDDALDRFNRVMEETARWFGEPVEALHGWRLILHPGFLDDHGTLGRCTWSETTIRLGVRQEERCVERLVLPHEMMHVWIGDKDHIMPIWSDGAQWGALAAHLVADRPGC